MAFLRSICEKFHAFARDLRAFSMSTLERETQFMCLEERRDEEEKF